MKLTGLAFFVISSFLGCMDLGTNVFEYKSRSLVVKELKTNLQHNFELLTITNDTDTTNTTCLVELSVANDALSQKHPEPITEQKANNTQALLWLCVIEVLVCFWMFRNK